MSNFGAGGLVELAVVLACGFILCSWEPLGGYLRRQPPPVPYFTFLAVGVVWWVVVAASLPALARVCEETDICMPTFGQMVGFPEEQQHSVNALVAAILLWIALWSSAEKIWLRIRRCKVNGKEISKHFSEKLLNNIRNLKGWEFEKMVNEAAEKNKLIMLTLCSRKVYIGIPSELARDESKRERWVSIVPWQSGYRCEKTGELILTTDYAWMFKDQNALKDFSMCVPIREVVSFQFFDPSLYERFQLGLGRTKTDSLGSNEGSAWTGEATEQNSAKMRSADSVDSDGEREQGTNKQ